MSRHLPFSYRCGRCGRCCADMRIQLNPYEVARLAHGQGLSTTDFLARSTHSGVWLKAGPDGGCVFLGEAGCAAHPDRPLVCRLYPLGRHRTSRGGERFACLLPRPGSTGAYGPDGTIEDHLAANDATTFLEEADAWLALFSRAWSLFETLLGVDPLLAVLASDIRLLVLDGHAPPRSRLLDPDVLANSLCVARGLSPPKTPEEKTRLHREAVDQWLSGMGRTRDGGHERAETLARLVAGLGMGLGVNLSGLFQHVSDEEPPGAMEMDEALRLGADFL
ncbi:MAG TPA: YkgJ family cysteine cluster protein [Desulfovibrio sp.]|uniref:YkgJ family cysteine cluster protein n=1 Tax=Desulfovibrio sp. TaxID=885 RepID=UPI002C937C8A|nr:YkgJ family cysteine cluster protein [Desulfovibrio sp.]HMM39200.1 YkgJ family cysteine cluster protein [Desulfovibrio sp.]